MFFDRGGTKADFLPVGYRLVVVGMKLAKKDDPLFRFLVWKQPKDRRDDTFRQHD
jgi:hypothetical protein